MSSKITLKRVCIEEWEEILNSQNVMDLFYQEEFISSCEPNALLLEILNGQEIIGICILPPIESKYSVQNDLLIHSGLYFFENYKLKTESLKFNEVRFRTNQSIVKFIEQNFNSIKWRTNYEYQDLRPYLWHNYGVEGSSFTAIPRYTLIKDISDLNAENPMNSDAFNTMVYTRRRLVRIGLKEKGKIIYNFSTEEFVKSYSKMMGENNSEITSKTIRDMTLLINSLKKSNLCKIYQVNSSLNTPLYRCIFGLSGEKAYYLFGSKVNAQDTTTWHGTFILWSAFVDLAKHGIKKVDLEGVNSPKRGWFKESFGGELKTYYELSMK